MLFNAKNWGQRSRSPPSSLLGPDQIDPVPGYPSFNCLTAVQHDTSRTVTGFGCDMQRFISYRARMGLAYPCQISTGSGCYVSRECHPQTSLICAPEGACAIYFVVEVGSKGTQSYFLSRKYYSNVTSLPFII